MTAGEVADGLADQVVGVSKRPEAIEYVGQADCVALSRGDGELECAICWFLRCLVHRCVWLWVLADLHRSEFSCVFDVDHRCKK